AGLEAARVLGERGHRVIVLEAADSPGGQVRLAASAARRHDLIGIVDWRVAEARRAGVEFSFDQLADAETVLAADPDLVVIATGGLPDVEVIAEGVELAHDTWDVMDGAFRSQG